MKKTKITMISILSLLFIVLSYYSISANEQKELAKDKEKNIAAEKYKEQAKKADDEKKLQTKIDDEIVVKLEKDSNLAKKTVKEEAKEVAKEEVKEIVEPKETTDYIWVEESFGSIDEVIVEDSQREKGDRAVDEGSYGRIDLQYKVTYLDGVEVSRVLTGEEDIISNPSDTIIYIGTMITEVAVDDGNYLRNEASRMLAYVNDYRISQGLSPFVESGAVNNVADIRAKELTQLVSHTRPNGTPWYTVGANVSSENLAGGYDARETVDEWIASPGHNTNLLNNSYYAGVSMYRDTDGTMLAVLLTAY